MDGSRLEDGRLLSYVAAGDKEVFHRLYENTARVMYGYILSYVKNPQDTEEVMQEAYPKVQTLADSCISQGKPIVWLFTIVRNLCLIRFWQQKHRTDMSTHELRKQELGKVYRGIGMAPGKMALFLVLSLLKEEDRQTVLLHEAGRLKHREIAKNLEMPLATVLSKYGRTIKKMAGYMGQGQAGGR